MYDSLFNLHTPLSLQIVNKIAPFVQFPFAILLFPNHLLSAHPSSTLPHNFSHKHKIVFPSTFFSLCLLTTQIKSLPPSHKMSSIYFNYIISATFTEIVIQLPTSTQLLLASTPPLLLIFAPQFLISTLITFMLLMFNNVLMF